ncbi:uncharacterized protein EV420DRAFT_154870 [Desarmillaria tabescens]|uniref:Apple domain-containing protein n=1 Tax=Armillaria tabescens TaxID=1929756 RepID=A0AA39J843_ARMTA|nr:uncharacterized protein EV420DRAFT_154870 [Desarmillaria tabescens]KAK0437916.1 hypothetical protein EV420DRAFT_154870 [Desarmillaria tabescens]
MILHPSPSSFITMRFSVATLISLAALAAPALSAGVQARNGDVDHKDDGHKDDHKKDNGRKDCTWEPVFEHKNDFKGWNKGKYTPYDHKDVKKDTYEIDCKDLCEKDDRCNSCQAYSKEENEEKFICELFEEIIDILTWEDDCDEDKDDKHGKKDDKDRKDRHKYYDTSCWNAHYSY